MRAPGVSARHRAADSTRSARRGRAEPGVPGLRGLSRAILGLRVLGVLLLLLAAAVSVGAILAGFRGVDVLGVEVAGTRREGLLAVLVVGLPVWLVYGLVQVGLEVARQRLIARRELRERLATVHLEALRRQG